MKSHGYKEIMAYLRTGTPEREMLEEQISAKTRQYAKRQMTWWRGDPRIQWMTPHD
jgi:tRNA dimethylallyltransferase